MLGRFQAGSVPVSVLHGDGRAPRPRVREFVRLATARLRTLLREDGRVSAAP